MVHAFFVGHRVHPLAYHIYKYLADLNDRLDIIGYMQENISLP